jgi:hypothetical protein
MKQKTAVAPGIAVVLMMLAGCGKAPPPVKPGTPPTTTTTQPPEAAAPRALPVSIYKVSESTVMPPDYVAPTGRQVEVYGNYDTAGVIADIPEGMTGGQVWQMRCYLNVDGAWKPMQDLVQVRDYAWFATSLFWLKPDSAYQVKVVVIDRQNKIRATWYGAGRTRREPVIPSTDNNVYVATTGNDANPGTKEQPFRTIGHAVTNAVAGTTIWVNGGVYHEGNLVFTKSGAPGRPIVLRAVPGENAVMDGSDPDLVGAGAWQPVDDGLYRHAFETFASCMVVEDRKTGQRLRLMPVHTLDELRRRAVKKWTEDMPDHASFRELGLAGGVYNDGTNAWLALPGPVENYRLYISRRQLGIYLENRHDIMVDGITFRYYGAVGFTGGMHLYNSSDVLVQGCLFEFCDFGVGIKLKCDRVTIQDCRFADVTGFFPFGMLKMEGVPCTYETGAVNVTAKYSGRGLVFRRNRIEGYFDGAHLTPWTEDDARSNETDFYHNVIDVCLDDFIEADGYSRNVRIFENYMDRSLSGVSLAQALDGPTFVVYNVIANSGLVRSAQVEGNIGRPFKTNGGPEADVGSGPVFFYHNTAWSSDTNSRAMLVTHAKWAKITFRNNIWCGGSMGAECWESQLSPMDFDYDNLYSMNTNGPLFQIAYHNNYKTLDDVRRKLRYLRHGISAEPRLAAPGRGDFRLAAGSPCVDAGIAVPGITDGRILGTAPDMGAYELR